MEQINYINNEKMKKKMEKKEVTVTTREKWVGDERRRMKSRNDSIGTRKGNRTRGKEKQEVTTAVGGCQEREGGSGRDHQTQRYPSIVRCALGTNEAENECTAPGITG